jgi:capsular exopolysaccharide synthesis family protein
MRSIGTSIRLFDIDNPPKVVLMTSAEPSEGKSTIAISVARVQALAGLKVVIVDTDIRKPVVHERLAVRRAPGLVEVLDGKHTLSEAIITDEKTGVDVLPVGVPVSTDTLAFDRMRNFLNDLRDQYDLIIIDSAPILAVSDARILPAISDMTIFSVRWRETRREVVRLAIKQLRESGARMGGIVLSRVNIKSHRQYGYGDSALYSGKLKKYYTQTS